MTFSDGTTLTVPAGKTVTTGAYTWSGGNATGGGDPSTLAAALHLHPAVPSPQSLRY